MKWVHDLRQQVVRREENPTQEHESAREESAQENSGEKLELAIELEGLTDSTDSITDRFLQLTTDPTFSQHPDARDMKMK